MNNRTGNDIVATALLIARQAYVTDAFDGFTCGYQLGVINMAENYIGAERWIAQGARNEIQYMSQMAINKGVK